MPARIPQFPNFTPISELEFGAISNTLDRLAASNSQLQASTIWFWDAAVCAHGGSICIWYQESCGWPHEVSLVASARSGARAALDLLDWMDVLQTAPLKLMYLNSNTATLLSASSDLVVVHDRSESDYIFNTADARARIGGRYKRLRYSLRRAERQLGPIRFVHYSDEQTHEIGPLLVGLSEEWLSTAGTQGSRLAESELRAIRRFVDRPAEVKDGRTYYVTMCLMGGKSIGWAGSEYRGGSELIGHFLKYRPMPNLSLSHCVVAGVVDLAARLGAPTVNGGPDMGLAGLREFKTSWRPVTFKESYIAQPI